MRIMTILGSPRRRGNTPEKIGDDVKARAVEFAATLSGQAC